MSKKINYFARNFSDTRTELVNFIKQYYPNLLSDFNDSSIGSVFIDLNAAVTDLLSTHTDRMFQETQIDFAKERSSVLSLARTFGLKIPGKRPSITICDFSVIVPVNGDSFDLQYAPVIRRGAQVGGAGKIFETLEDIDFASPFSSGGIPNRLIIPNINANNTIVNYTLTKREIVINGVSKIFKKVVTPQDVKPFMNIILPDSDVLSIESIIVLEGTNNVGTPTNDMFYGTDNRWFEMDALSDDKIFIENTTIVSDNPSIKPGKWVRVDQKFITEYTDKGFMKITFGGGNQDVSGVFNIDSGLLNKIGDFINNLSLGITHKANTTIFVKYRVGGGSSSNLGSSVLTSIVSSDMFVNGPDNNRNQIVRDSLKANNPIPCMGGKDEPSVNEIRNIVKYNFSSQNRAVTLKDYMSRIALMPGDFGVPYKYNVFEEQNKIIVNILGVDPSGKLTNQSTNTLKDNISEYLSDYRMINDYVQIRNGKIINLGLDVDLMVDKKVPKSQIISEVIAKIGEYFDVKNFEMGDNIYIANLIENINNINGVLNVTDIKIFNKVGGDYSKNEISQPYVNDATREIDLLGEYTLFADGNSLFEIKNLLNDVRCRVK